MLSHNLTKSMNQHFTQHPNIINSPFTNNSYRQTHQKPIQYPSIRFRSNSSLSTQNEHNAPAPIHLHKQYSTQCPRKQARITWRALSSVYLVHMGASTPSDIRGISGCLIYLTIVVCFIPLSSAPVSRVLCEVN